MAKRLVMYCRDSYCPDQALARRLLKAWGVSYQEVNISRDRQASERVQKWNNHQGVPTLIVAEDGSVEPIAPPTAVSPGQRTRNLNRGSLICEPNETGLREFLQQHGLMPQ